MKVIALGLALGLASVAGGWQLAMPGWRYDFPRDHHLHEMFRTEWWYFTGNLTDSSGRRFGYELTFFRQGIRSPSERAGTTSRFIVDDLKFAHFTVTNETGKNFLFFDRASRGGFGDAGFDQGKKLAWIDGWTLGMNADGSFDLTAEAREAQIELHLAPQKPPVIHGTDGISRKAKGEGHASHYYSITRLATTGSVQVGHRIYGVTGESWFDHEWATNQLAPGQAGWNWISAQFDNQTELMLYEMRLTDGGIDPASSGTFVRPDGSSVSLTSADFKMTPTAFWRSAATQANYPIAWRVEVPKEQLDFVVRPILENQELVFTPLIYWEGAFEVVGTRAGQPLHGHGYLELTGYVGQLGEMLNR